jgi:hypothetical protein
MADTSRRDRSFHLGVSAAVRTIGPTNTKLGAAKRATGNIG